MRFIAACERWPLRRVGAVGVVTGPRSTRTARTWARRGWRRRGGGRARPPPSRGRALGRAEEARHGRVVEAGAFAAHGGRDPRRGERQSRAHPRAPKLTGRPLPKSEPSSAIGPRTMASAAFWWASRSILARSSSRLSRAFSAASSAGNGPAGAAGRRGAASRAPAPRTRARAPAPSWRWIHRRPRRLVQPELLGHRHDRHPAPAHPLHRRTLERPGKHPPPSPLAHPSPLQGRKPSASLHPPGSSSFCVVSGAVMRSLAGWPGRQDHGGGAGGSWLPGDGGDSTRWCAHAVGREA